MGLPKDLGHGLNRLAVDRLKVPDRARVPAESDPALEAELVPSFSPSFEAIIGCAESTETLLNCGEVVGRGRLRLGIGAKVAPGPAYSFRARHRHEPAVDRSGACGGLRFIDGGPNRGRARRGQLSPAQQVARLDTLEIR